MGLGSAGLLNMLRIAPNIGWQNLEEAMPALPMRRAVAALALAAVPWLAPWTAQAQAIAVKTGGWDMTYKTQTDMPGLPPELEKMAPAQRAKMEAALRESWKPRSHAAKTCLTKADLAQMAKGPDDEGGCKYSNVKVSSSRWEGDVTCGGGRTGRAVLDAPSPDRVNGTVIMRIPTSKGDGKSTMELSGRWASASCKGFDD